MRVGRKSLGNRAARRQSLGNEFPPDSSSSGHRRAGDAAEHLGKRTLRWLAAKMSQHWLASLLCMAIATGAVLESQVRPATTLVIEAFAVPESLREAGISPEVVAEKVRAAVLAIDNASNYAYSSNRSPTVQGKAQGEALDVELPGTKIGLRQAVEYVQALLRGAPIRVTGHFVDASTGWTVVMRVVHAQSQGPDEAIGPSNSVDALVNHVAERILTELKPATLAGYLYYQAKRTEDAHRVIELCKSRVEPFKVADCLVASGDIARSESDYARADARYREALHWNPDSVEARTSIGWLAMDRGDDAMALEEFEAAVRLDPTAAQPHFDLADLMLRGENWARAREEAERALALSDGKSLALAAAALPVGVAGDWERAKALIDEAIAKSPRGADAYATRARLHMTRGQFAEAGTLWKAALDRASEDEYLHNDWGNYLMSFAHVKAALSEYASALGHRSNDHWFHVNQGWAFAGLGRFDEALNAFGRAGGLMRLPSTLLAEANVLARRGDFGAALRKKEEAERLASDGFRSGDHVAWALVLEGRNDLLGAKASYDQALQRVPWNVFARWKLANVLASLGRFTEANAEFSHAARLSPGHVDVLREWGRVLANHGRMHAAEQKWREALTVNPDNGYVSWVWGDALMSRGDLVRAEQHYQRALEFNPGEPEFHVDLGMLRAAQGRSREAIDSFERALDLNPSLARARIEWGRLFLDDGRLRRHERLTKAETQWSAAAAIAPGDANVHCAWGDALAGHDLEAAKSHYLQALALNPEDADPHVLLGHLYARWGRREDARSEYEAALSRNPGSVDALIGWGQLIANDERIPEPKRLLDAVRKWQQANAINPRNVWVHQAWGEALEARGFLEGAVFHYQIWRNIEPWEAQPHYYLGLNYRERGLLELAATEFQRALTLNPGHTVSNVAWAEMLAANQALLDAEAKWSAALRGGPGDGWVHRRWGDALDRLSQREQAESHWRLAERLDPTASIYH